MRRRDVTRALPITAGLLALMAYACGPRGKGTAVPSAPTEPTRDAFGPIAPPRGFDFDVRGSAPLTVAGASTPAGRVVAIAVPVEAPVVQVHDSKAGPTVFPLEDVRVAARNVDVEGPWTFFDLARGTGEVAATPAALDTWMFHDRVMPSHRPGELVLQEVASGGVRPLTVGLQLGPPAKEPLGDPLAACGGAAEVATRVGGTPVTPATVVDVKQGGTTTTKPALGNAVKAAVRATACCDGELAWVEVHTPTGAASTKIEATPNSPMLVGVQGMKSGMMADDLFPNLVGADDVDLEIARFGLGCLGGKPIVAVLLNNVRHVDELWVSVPRVSKAAGSALATLAAGPAGSAAASADAGAAEDAGEAAPSVPRAMCEGVKDAGAKKK